MTKAKLTGTYWTEAIAAPYLHAKISPEKRQIDIVMHLRFSLCEVCSRDACSGEPCAPIIDREAIINEIIRKTEEGRDADQPRLAATGTALPSPAGAAEVETLHRE